MAILALVAAACLTQDDPRLAARLKELESSDVRVVYRAVERLAEIGQAALPSLETHQKTAPARVDRPRVNCSGWLPGRSPPNVQSGA